MKHPGAVIRPRPGQKEYKHMSRYQKRRATRNYPLQPDLFDWARERDLRAANPNARRLADRYGISVQHAATIAAAAGLGETSR
jgi:hypothetical protein